MKTITCVGGEAHGRVVLDIGATTMRLSASPPQFYTVAGESPLDDVTEKLEDGYTRYQWEQLGWTHEVMLCDTLRPEDRHQWSQGLDIKPIPEQ